MAKAHGISQILRLVYLLVRPYGRIRLALVMMVSLTQALLQVISVAAVFPFLAMAANPSKFSSTWFGAWLNGVFPSFTDNEMLVLVGTLLIVALFVANVFNLFAEVYRAHFSWGFIHWLRMRMLNSIRARPYEWFLNQNSSILTKKATQDMSDFVVNILSPIIDGFSRLILSALLLTTVLIAEPQIAITVCLTIGVVYVLIYVFLSKYRRQISDLLKGYWREVFRHVGQFFAGIKPVKVHGAEQQFLSVVSENSQKKCELQSWLPLLINSPRYLIEPLIVAVLITIVLLEVSSGRDVADLVPGLGIIAMAGYRLMPAIQMVYSQLSTIQASRFVLEEIYDEFREIEEDKQAYLVNVESKNKLLQKLEFENNIELKGVSFAYRGTDRKVLEDISFSIPKNTSVAFIGETGSGKSTLVDLILGLHRPSSGGLHIDGVLLDDEKKIRAWQNRIGYVPQDIFLADDSIQRNIAFGIADEDIDSERVRHVAAMAQIAGFVETDLTDRYETQVGEHGVRLSGGQRQRIALARALYHQPDVLLLDEATSALDVDTEERFMKTVYGLMGEFTIIMVAHRLSTTQRVDTRYRVDKGKVELG